MVNTTKLVVIVFPPRTIKIEPKENINIILKILWCIIIYLIDFPLQITLFFFIL